MDSTDKASGRTEYSEVELERFSVYSDETGSGAGASRIKKVALLIHETEETFESFRVQSEGFNCERGVQRGWWGS